MLRFKRQMLGREGHKALPYYVTGLQGLSPSYFPTCQSRTRVLRLISEPCSVAVAESKIEKGHVFEGFAL